MLNKLDYSYNGNNSIMHNINALVKLIGLIGYFVICLFKFNNILFICNISFVYLLLLLSNISISKYLKIIWKLKCILIIFYVLLMRLGMSINDINILMFKVIFLILYIAMIRYTTTKEELSKSIVKLFDIVNILGLNMKGIILFFNNILYYIDCYIDSYNELVIDMELKGRQVINNNILDRFIIIIKNRNKILNSVSLKMKQRKMDMGYRLYDKRIKSKYKYEKRLSIFDYVYILFFIGMILFYIVRVR